MSHVGIHNINIRHVLPGKPLSIGETVVGSMISRYNVKTNIQNHHGDVRNATNRNNFCECVLGVFYRSPTRKYFTKLMTHRITSDFGINVSARAHLVSILHNG